MGEFKWFYKDPAGLIQGPFNKFQMSQWYEIGYFQDDLEIAFGENSMFLPLYRYKEINL
jgi:GYF domain